MFSCWDQGGCCSPVPPVVELGLDGVPNRVNIMYYPLAFCGPNLQPLQVEYMSSPHPTLAERGLSQSDWVHQVTKLQEIAKSRKGCCADCLACLPFLFCPCFLYICCRRTKVEVMNWDRQLRDWQDQFNEMHLIRIGVFVKTKSHCFVTYGDKGQKQRHYNRWLAFAIGDEEIAKLKAEPHLLGDVEDTTCCGGFNEQDCCVHPAN